LATSGTVGEDRRLDLLDPRRSGGGGAPAARDGVVPHAGLKVVTVSSHHRSRKGCCWHCAQTIALRAN